MSNDTTKIMERIKKLMALGLGDPDSPEAKSAMDKAATLMEQYGVSEIDLDKDGHVKVDSMVEKFVEVFSKHTEIWEAPLGNKIAKSFDCRMLTIRSAWKNDLPTRTFLGAKSDVELATYFYKFIRMQIFRRSEAEYRLVRDRKAYGYGCTLKVVERLQEMYAKREEIMTAGTKDLMVVKKDDVSRYCNRKYPHTNKRKGGKITGDYNAFNKGKEDGGKIQMSRQVGNKSASGATLIGA